MADPRWRLLEKWWHIFYVISFHLLMDVLFTFQVQYTVKAWIFLEIQRGKSLGYVSVGHLGKKTVKQNYPQNIQIYTFEFSGGKSCSRLATYHKTCRNARVTNSSHEQVIIMFMQHRFSKATINFKGGFVVTFSQKIPAAHFWNVMKVKKSKWNCPSMVTQALLFTLSKAKVRTLNLFSHQVFIRVFWWAPW